MWDSYERWYGNDFLFTNYAFAHIRRQFFFFSSSTWFAKVVTLWSTRWLESCVRNRTRGTIKDELARWWMLWTWFPTAKVLSEFVCFLKHAIHALDIANIPIPNISIKVTGTMKHGFHIKYIFHIPVSNGLIKVTGTVKHEAHVLYIPDIPLPNMHIEVFSTQKHGRLYDDGDNVVWEDRT